MGRRKKGKNRTGLSAGTFLLLAGLGVILFSLAVRWMGWGRGFARQSEPFRIEVLNGTGEPGVAGEMTLQLRQMGIDVLIEGNAESFDFRESLLIDRKNNAALMKKLSRRLGCDRVIEQVQDHPHVDATLIIGWDREKLKIRKLK